MALTGNEFLQLLGPTGYGGRSGETFFSTLNNLPNLNGADLFLVLGVLPNGMPAFREHYVSVANIGTLNAGDIIYVQGVTAYGALSGSTEPITGAQLQSFYSPQPPTGQVFLLDPDGAYLTDPDGAYLTEAA